MDDLTQLEAGLLDEIRKAPVQKSLFRLAIHLEYYYPTAWRCLKKLESLQLVEVERNGRGSPLIMRAIGAGRKNHRSEKFSTDKRQATGGRDAA